jgi:hypothetical protein
MVLAGEGFTERWGHKDSRREVGVLKQRETVADKQRGGRDIGEERVVVVLGLFPFSYGRGQQGVAGSGEVFE